jgi:hypothetical protein
MEDHPVAGADLDFLLQDPGELQPRRDREARDQEAFGLRRPQPGIRFYLGTKTVTQRWPSCGAVLDQSFVIPTMR